MQHTRKIMHRLVCIFNKVQNFMKNERNLNKKKNFENFIKKNELSNHNCEGGINQEIY